MCCRLEPFLSSPFLIVEGLSLWCIFSLSLPNVSALRRRRNLLLAGWWRRKWWSLLNWEYNE
jgi:hypothetical protein